MAPRIVVLTCLLLLFCASTAGAEAGSAGPDYARPGWYLGAGFSVGFEAFSGLRELEAAIGENVVVSESFGVNGRVGYRLLPWLALETQFEWFSDWNYSVKDVDFGPGSDPGNIDFFSVEDYTLTVNAKGYPLKGRVQPFGLIGVGGMLALNTDKTRNNRTVDVGGFVARFGGGVDYYLDESWILTLDASYLVTTGNVEETDRTSLGIGFQYRF